MYVAIDATYRPLLRLLVTVALDRNRTSRIVERVPSMRFTPGRLNNALPCLGAVPLVVMFLLDPCALRSSLRLFSSWCLPF